MTTSKPKNKSIKFDLSIDGTKVKNIEELREHFTVEILELYNNGMLIKWLKSRKNLEEASRVEKINATQLSQGSLLNTLCEIFTVDKIKDKAETKLSRSTSSDKYLIHENRTVIDTETHLMWKQDSEVGKHKWNDAMAKFGKNVNFAGYNDWRMPTIEELKTLVKHKHYPAIDSAAFPNTPSVAFWAASPYTDDGRIAWFVGFHGDGCYDFNFKALAFQVRLVRNAQ